MSDSLLTRAATFEPASYNDAERTVEVVWSTGAEVIRNGFDGQFIERLDMSPGAWDLTEFRGAPVLNSHGGRPGPPRFDINDILGIVEEASVDGKRGVARVRFGVRAESQGITADVKGGIIRHVSVGYTVAEWKTEKRADGVRIMTAVKSKAKELSFTALAADAGATTRSKEPTMDLSQQIRSIATAVGLQGAFVDDLVQRSVPVEDARRALVQEAARSAPPIDGRQPIQITREPAEDMLRDMADGLLVRVRPSHKPTEQGRRYVGMSCVDLARECLRQRSLSTFGSGAEIITRSLATTSDFPALLSNLANKVLEPAYQLAPSGVKRVTKPATTVDFKPRNVLRRGEMPQLEKVNEKGEFRRGGVLEAKESYNVDTFGKVFGLSRQALINDDLNAFGDIAAGWGTAAIEFENQHLVSVLTTNNGNGPVMSDGKTLFHVDHGNMAGASADVDADGLSEGRLALRRMKGLDGMTPINAAPRYLVVPAALETAGQRALAAIYPATSENVNPFAGDSIQLVVDPRLDDADPFRWYMFADYTILPVLEYSYLQGYEGVYVEARIGFDVDGVEFKARLDFGAGAIDFRGVWTAVASQINP